MALDLPALRVQISATTGDTVSKIDEVRNSLENVKDTNSQMSTSLQQTNAASAESFGNLSGAVKAATSAATGDISGFVSTATGMLSQFGAAGTLAAAGIGMVVDAVKDYQNGLTATVAKNEDNLKNFAAYADEILTKSTITGLSDEFVDLYTKMSGITDVDFSTIESATTKLNEEVGKAVNGDAGAIKKFKDLGVAIYGEDGKPRSTENIFDDVLQAIRAIPTEAQQAQAAADVFGKGAGSALLPLIRNGNRSYAALKSIADEYRILSTSNELSLGGVVQDMKDIAEQAENATKNMQGLRTAAADLKQTQAEASISAATTRWLNDEIDFETYSKIIIANGGEVVEAKADKYAEAKAQKAAEEYAKEIQQAIANGIDITDPMISPYYDALATKAQNAKIASEAAGNYVRSDYEVATLQMLYGDDYWRHFDNMNTKDATLTAEEILKSVMAMSGLKVDDVNTMDESWVEEIKTMIADLETGDLTQDQYTDQLMDMFARFGTTDWDNIDTSVEEIAADVGEIAKKKPEVKVDVKIEDKTKISFNGGQVNSDPDYDVSAQIATAAE